jgi:hypothetical protein
MKKSKIKDRMMEVHGDVERTSCLSSFGLILQAITELPFEVRRQTVLKTILTP